MRLAQDPQNRHHPDLDLDLVEIHPRDEGRLQIVLLAAPGYRSTADLWSMVHSKSTFENVFCFEVDNVRQAQCNA